MWQRNTGHSNYLSTWHHVVFWVRKYPTLPEDPASTVWGATGLLVAQVRMTGRQFNRLFYLKQHKPRSQALANRLSSGYNFVASLFRRGTSLILDKNFIILEQHSWTIIQMFVTDKIIDEVKTQGICTYPRFASKLDKHLITSWWYLTLYQQFKNSHFFTGSTPPLSLSY